MQKSYIHLCLCKKWIVGGVTEDCLKIYGVIGLQSKFKEVDKVVEYEKSVIKVVASETYDSNAKIISEEREVRIEFPEGMELSEEEIMAVATVAENEIVDIVRAKQVTTKPKPKVKVVPIIKVA
jgi:hypothetical protein